MTIKTQNHWEALQSPEAPTTPAYSLILIDELKNTWNNNGVVDATLAGSFFFRPTVAAANALSYKISYFDGTNEYTITELNQAATASGGNIVLPLSLQYYCTASADSELRLYAKGDAGTLSFSGAYGVNYL